VVDAIALLKEDHKTVKQLFKRFEGLGERAHKTKGKLVEQILRELSIHAYIEEEAFYPAVRESVAEADDIVLESFEEHHIVEWTLSELQAMDPKDERFDAKVTVLIELVRDHIKEEEKEMFPQVRKALSRQELVELGERMEEVRASAPTEPQPRSDAEDRTSPTLARDEGSHAAGQAATSQTIEEVMTPDPVTILASVTIVEAARLMREADTGAMVVLDEDEEVQGILTDRDIAIRSVAEDRDPSQTRVGEISSADVTTLEPGASVAEAVRLMREKAIRRLPVVEGGRPVGIVSIGDLAEERDPRSALADISRAPADR
jgi:CBS domain-containing protein/hemerythrin superfamily protein